jgi:biotin carboxyl carrier protein
VTPRLLPVAATDALLVGFSDAAAGGLARELAARGVTTATAADAAEGEERLRRTTVGVLCLGPALAGSEAAALLRRAAERRAESRRADLVLAAGDDLSPFQELVDADRLFFLAARCPAPEEVCDLVAAAVARVRGAARAPAPGGGAREEAARDTARELCRQLARTGEPAAAAALIARAARQLVGAERARSVVVDEAADTFREEDGRRPGPAQSCAAGLVGFALRTGRGVRVERVGEDPRWDAAADSPGGAADDRLLAVPLAAGAPPRPWAAVVLSRDAAEPSFTAEDEEALASLAARVAPLAELVVSRHPAGTAGLRGAGDASGGGEAGDLFRRRAVERHAGGAGSGGSRPLEVSPAWIRRTSLVLVAVFAAGLGFLALASIDQYAAGPAVVRADGRTDVTARATGTVARIAVAPGEPVVAGQLLLELDDAGEAAELARVESELELALAQRLREPEDRAVEARLQGLRAARDLAAARRAARSVRAPHGGVVGELRARLGRQVAPGEVLLSLSAAGGELSVVVMFPGHHRPLLRPGMPLRLELDGHRHAYQRLTIERVSAEAVGPAEARRVLGAEIGDVVPLSTPVVFATARLPAGATFGGDGGRFPYHEGQRGTGEVRVRSERVLGALVPGLRALLGDADAGGSDG